MHSLICNVACNGEALGYSYCGYKDCSNSDGDFTQVVSKCDPRSATRTVTYELKPGRTCQYVARKENAPAVISCEYTPYQSAYGQFDTALAVIGILICLIILVVTWRYRSERESDMQ